MSLKKQIADDYKKNVNLINSYYIMRSHQMGRLISKAKEDAVKIITAHLSFLHVINGAEARKFRIQDKIEHDLKRRFDTLGHELNDIKELMFKQMNLWGRLYSGFVARKTQPPWMPVKLDLYNGFDVQSDWSNRTHFYLKNMSDTLVREVNQGILNEESMHQILQRIRPKFNRGARSREANWQDPFLKDIAKLNDQQQTESWQQTEEFFDKPPVEISEGIFTLEDVSRLKEDQIDSMRWSSRQYRPWFDETLKRSNRDLRAFEVNMMADMRTALHEGMLQVGSENMGVEDFVWKVSKPQPKCDQCTKRDGLTTKQIAKTIKDEWGDQPPPLHPNCMCQYVPDIKDEWAEKTLEQNGFEFDPADGISFEPTGDQRELGFTDMSWDDWLGNIGH